MNNLASHHQSKRPDVMEITAEQVLVTLAGRALSLATKQNGRIVLGIAGGPGSGKSTMVETLRDMLNEMVPQSTAVLPMDGFHRPHAKLVATGDAEQKGAPHTFHVAGFISCLNKIRAAKDDVSCPTYSREIEDVIENSIVIAQNTPIVIVEGNYLLLDQSPWDEVKAHFDLTAFLSVQRDVVMRRLLARHAEHGLFSQDHINAHVEKVDLANYDLVDQSKHNADLVFEISDAE